MTAQTEQRDQDEQLDPQQPRLLNPRFTEVGCGEGDKRQRVSNFDTMRSMTAMPSCNESSEHQPCKTFEQVEPVIEL